MPLTTKKKNLILNYSKEIHDLFRPYRKPWYSNSHYPSIDQDKRSADNGLHYPKEKYQQKSSDGSFARKLIRRKRALKDGSCQKNANRSKVNNVASRQYPISYQQYPTPSRQYPISYQQYPIAPQQYPISYQQNPIILRQNPISYQQCPTAPRQNAISYQQYPIAPHKIAWSSLFCPTEVGLFNSEIQFLTVSGRQIDADDQLKGLGNYERYYQCTLKTIEETEAMSSRGPVHTINLIF